MSNTRPSDQHPFTQFFPYIPENSSEENAKKTNNDLNGIIVPQPQKMESTSNFEFQKSSLPSSFVPSLDTKTTPSAFHPSSASK